MAQKDDKTSAYDVFFDGGRSKKDQSVGVIYEYEKHYLELLKHHKDEVAFIEDQLHDLRKEQVALFETVLPQIRAQLEKKSVDENVQQDWIKNFMSNMERSFSLSLDLLNDFAVKKVDEFRQETQKRVYGMK